jgi:hypothetical protein
MIKGRIERFRLESIANPIRAIETCACSNADKGTTMAEYKKGSVMTSSIPMPIIHFRNDWEFDLAIAVIY